MNMQPRAITSTLTVRLCRSMTAAEIEAVAAALHSVLPEAVVSHQERVTPEQYVLRDVLPEFLGADSLEESLATGDWDNARAVEGTLGTLVVGKDHQADMSSCYVSLRDLHSNDPDADDDRPWLVLSLDTLRDIPLVERMRAVAGEMKMYDVDNGDFYYPEGHEERAEMVEEAGEGPTLEATPGEVDALIRRLCGIGSGVPD